MVIKFFRSSFVTQYTVISVIGLVLWLISAFNPPAIPQPYGPVPIYTLLYSLIKDLPLLSVILGFILVLIEMYWLNLILSNHELIQKNSSLAAFLFILLMSFYPEAMILNPVNILVLFLLVIIHNLLISYKKPEHLDRTFAAGFFTSLASMFYFPFIIWCGLIFISFVLFRSGKWRQWISALLGLLTPYIYLAVTWFWFDLLPEKINTYLDFFRQIFVFPSPFQTDFWILGGMTLFAGLCGLSVLFTGPVEKTVEIRAKMKLFLWTIPFSILTIFISGPLAIFHPLSAAPAFSLVVASALQGIRKPSRVEWFLWVYFFMILANTLYLHRLLSQQ